jgi:hypothetical protein
VQLALGFYVAPRGGGGACGPALPGDDLPGHTFGGGAHEEKQYSRAELDQLAQDYRALIPAAQAAATARSGEMFAANGEYRAALNEHNDAINRYQHVVGTTRTQIIVDSIAAADAAHSPLAADYHQAVANYHATRDHSEYYRSNQLVEQIVAQENAGTSLNDLVMAHPDVIVAHANMMNALSAVQLHQMAVDDAIREAGMARMHHDGLVNSTNILAQHSNDNGVQMTWTDHGPVGGNRAQLNNMFQRPISESEIRALVGASPGSEVIVQRVNGDQLRFTMNAHDGSKNVMTLIETPDGVMIHHDLVVNLGEKTQDSGTQIFDSMMAMHDMGVTHMEAEAARGHGGGGIEFVGYKSWPGIGFTGAIPVTDHAGAPLLAKAQTEWNAESNRVLGRDIKNVEDFQKLGARAKAWWIANGDSFEASFDFRPGTESMAGLNKVYSFIHRPHRNGPVTP